MAITTRAGKGSALTHAEMDANINAIPEVLDEDNMASNSASKVPSQQSVKAYVDANAGSGGSSGVDWTVDQGATNIHAGNYTDTNTTYSVGDGGLTEKNFTAALNTKLGAIEASATADQTNAEIKTAYEANADTNEFSDAEQTKLSGVATSANNYSLPVASGTVSGGVKVGANLTMTDGVLAATGGTGGGSGVDWTVDQGATNIHAGNYTDTNTTYSVGDAGLTEKNFTAALNTKLDGVATSANNYSLPVASGTVSGGVKVGANLSIANGVLAATDTNTTYSVGDGGLTQNNFTNDDHTKLNGIATSANNYSLPVASGSTSGGVKVGANLSIANGILAGTDTNTTYSAGTGITLTGTTFSASPIALTTVQTAANQAAQLALTAQEGDIVVRSDENKTYCHNGGSAGTMADFTLLATPTDTVLSVNGATGAVTLTHDGFSDFVANEHIDWTTDQGNGSIYAGNYINTTYSVGDGGLTQNNFTNDDHTKLNGIATSANNYSLPVASGTVS